MDSLIIPMVFLVITMFSPDEQWGQAVVPMDDGMKQCNYIKQTMINDELLTQKAEAKQKKEDIVPRITLKVVSCMKIDVPLRGQRANF